MSQPERSDGDLLDFLIGLWGGAIARDRLRTWREHILEEVGVHFAGRSSGERSEFLGRLIGAVDFQNDDERREVFRVTRRVQEEGYFDDPAALADDDEDEPGRPLSAVEVKQRRIEAKTQRDAKLEEFNKRFAMVREGGTAVVFDDCWDEVLKRRYYDRLKPSAFQTLYSREKICTRVGADGRRQTQPLGKWWLSHPEGRSFTDGVVFLPHKEAPPGFLNLWRGFAYEPKPGSWQRLKDHLRYVLCAGDPACFTYVMGWLASAVQRPEIPAGVVLVFRGLTRTGKGILGHAMRRLFGQHGLHVSTSKHLVGHFNEHLRDCVFLFADEAFFAGDKANESTLKALITEGVITVEAKYLNAVQCANMLSIVMLSNSDWVVPVQIGDERFFVQDVLPTHQGERPYFRAIIEELEAGGYEAMLHDLLAYDLTGFEIRDFPRTQALRAQQQFSLGTTYAWLRDVLERGYVFESRLGLAVQIERWFDTVPVALLYKSYRAYAKENGERHPLHQGGLVDFLVDKFGWERVRPDQYTGIVGEQVAGGGRAEVVYKRRPRCVRIGPLIAACEKFTGETGLAIEAPIDPEDEEGVDNVLPYRAPSSEPASSGDLDVPF